MGDVSDYECDICCLVARQPVNVSCGTYCKGCLKQWLANNSTCPKRCGTVHYRGSLPINQWLEARIHRLEVTCINEGCTSKVVLSRFEEHQQKCVEELVP